MSGNPDAFTQMLSYMNHGGRIAALGIPSTPIQINFNQIIFKGLILKGIYGREIFETWYKMITLLQSGLNISPVITHHFSYQNYEQAFAVMASGQSGKVILDWTV
jgi:threonine 3-dehydrogenase